MIQPRHLTAIALGVALLYAPCASADPSPSDIPFGEPVPAAAASRATTQGDGMRTAGWISIGAGLASLAVGATCFVIADNDDREVKSKFLAGQTPTSSELHADGHWSVAGVAVSAVGLLAVGTGITLVLLAPKHGAPSVDIAIAPRAALLSAHF